MRCQVSPSPFVMSLGGGHMRGNRRGAVAAVRVAEVAAAVVASPPSADPAADELRAALTRVTADAGRDAEAYLIDTEVPGGGE